MRLSMLRPLYEQAGPWASVYVDTSRNTEDGAEQVDLRWRAARESLAADGCDEDTLDAMEQAVLERPQEPGRHGLAVFAAHGAVALAQPLDAPPRREIAAFGPLPHTMPLVAQLGEQIPYVQVLVDHTGGFLTGTGPGRLVRTASVEGSQDFPIRKSNVGGWQQSHWQQAAQESWQRNAGEVAVAVAELAEGCDAQVIVVGGDPRSRPMLVERLPERWRDLVVTTEAGARAAGADPHALDEATIRAVAERAAAHETDVVDRYRMQRGRDAAAGDGLPAVVAALQRGQVDTVLLVDDPSSTQMLWAGPEPLQLSYDAAELHAMGVAAPWKVRADAALVRALACSDAGLTLVEPAELPVDGGVAALLRYADASTRHR
ncbi:Vms1/Ankzf1 family peptidyl-tRNA hydrolase [Dactylosporangium sp. NPDC050688]|uniref:baeRF2 domain-containing protein n=1 Tax=Dactylosporangium sp. NPDC050688 TaxID=3157217 RepID=UPI0033C8D1B5